MGIYEAVSLCCTLYCAGRFIWWLVDEWRIVPSGVGQRVTLSYILGWWSGGRGRR